MGLNESCGGGVPFLKILFDEIEDPQSGVLSYFKKVLHWKKKNIHKKVIRDL